jgi:hypothetical protein
MGLRDAIVVPAAPEASTIAADPARFSRGKFAEIAAEPAGKRGPPTNPKQKKARIQVVEDVEEVMNTNIRADKPTVDAITVEAP